ncbi:MAPEG family protein [Legionella sp. MW5194]|uniref:MAPEG family protein n=1 Tax=Legionella sp. MW5194 TaxID=2662448 RepID=UPI00193EBFD8|nr:MAPEG family protein [Legionella sp. MW5194]QRN03044.1 MAPEG family protein [Legionella sp. MW5194]
MTTLLICLFIAALLPYLSKLAVVYAIKKEGRYDNHHPRQQQAGLTGLGARAVAAHQNSFEALLVFSTAVLAALATEHTSTVNQYLAIAFIAARLAYHAIYLLNWSTLRSTIWFVGWLCSISILWNCIP